MKLKDAAKHSSDMNGGGSRACLGHARRNKAKSAKAAAASARIREERKAQRLAMQEQGETGVRSIADLQVPASSSTSDLREGV
jgi:hypothetical protein